MSRHLERLLKIDSLLRSGIRQTQKSLSEATEVSDRTIRSDLDFLRDRFLAPLEYQKDKGWHYTDPDWRLPSISLSQGELFALTLGARMLSNYAGSAYVNELRTAIARLSERLPEASWVDLQKIADERISFSSGASINLDPEIWHKLELACKESKSIWMEYFTASRNASSDRQLDPYLLHIYRGTNPYVIGFCHKRQEVRWFRIDRIRSLKVLDEKFTVEPNFDGKGHPFNGEVCPKDLAQWLEDSEEQGQPDTKSVLLDGSWRTYPTSLRKEGFNITVLLEQDLKTIKSFKEIPGYTVPISAKNYQKWDKY